MQDRIANRPRQGSRAAVMFVEAGIADMDRRRHILARHSLLEAWAKFENRFLQP